MINLNQYRHALEGAHHGLGRMFLVNLVMENERFLDRLCACCEARCACVGTPYDDCPTGFDPLARGCERAGLVEFIVSLLVRDAAALSGEMDAWGCFDDEG